MHPDILWTPDPAKAAATAMARFMAARGHAMSDYRGLHAWSIADPGAFWSAIWDFAGIIGEKGDTAFVPDPAAWMTGARFFPDARLNFTQNLLRGAPGSLAVTEWGETGLRRSLTRGELTASVARVAAGLRAAGVIPGDRVAGIIPNTIEALVALLATASLGAIWTSCSPDFGTAAIVDRVGQVAPKVVFATPAYVYAGKTHDIAARLGEVIARMPSVELLVLSGPALLPDLPEGVKFARQESFGPPGAPDYPQFPYDQPLYILYTSGTTGAPKAIVHRAGGALLKHQCEHLLHCDIGPGDNLLWYSNTAWMMYHWMVSSLATGAAITLYDGAPILKTDAGLDCSPLWNAAEATGATHLGISPKYLSTVMAENHRPGARHDLARLRALMSSGAPMMPAQYDWIYAHVKGDLMYASISGGTELVGCFFIGSPIHPVRRGQVTVPALGMAVAVLDDRGAPCIGRRGELVCHEPFPTMPLTFWGPDGDARYRATYFADRPQIWTHGDIAEITPTGGGFVHGRSDSTLKPGGVRIGTSEIYQVCAGFPELADYVVFGAPHEGDEEVVLCLKPAADAAIDAGLIARLRAAIRHETSPRHVPARIHVVADVPMTINGKRVEGAARIASAGGAVSNLGSLANPECLDEYRNLDREKAL